MKRSRKKRALYARQQMALAIDRAWLKAAEDARQEGYASPERVAAIAADIGMDETEYLLSSPTNAARLAESIRQARAGQARTRAGFGSARRQAKTRLPGHPRQQ